MTLANNPEIDHYDIIPVDVEIPIFRANRGTGGQYSFVNYGSYEFEPVANPVVTESNFSGTVDVDLLDMYGDAETGYNGSDIYMVAHHSNGNTYGKMNSRIPNLPKVTSILKSHEWEDGVMHIQLGWDMEGADGLFTFYGVGFWRDGGQSNAEKLPNTFHLGKYDREKVTVYDYPAAGSSYNQLTSTYMEDYNVADNPEYFHENHFNSNVKIHHYSKDKEGKYALSEEHYNYGITLPVYVTGVEGVEAESDFCVSVEGQTLKVTGTVGQMAVHTVTGGCVYSGEVRELRLEREVYVVSVNGESRKIMVK